MKAPMYVERNPTLDQYRERYLFVSPPCNRCYRLHYRNICSIQSRMSPLDLSCEAVADKLNNSRLRSHQFAWSGTLSQKHHAPNSARWLHPEREQEADDQAHRDFRGQTCRLSIVNGIYSRCSGRRARTRRCEVSTLREGRRRATGLSVRISSSQSDCSRRMRSSMSEACGTNMFSIFDTESCFSGSTPTRSAIRIPSPERHRVATYRE